MVRTLNNMSLGGIVLGLISMKRYPEFSEHDFNIGLLQIATKYERIRQIDEFGALLNRFYINRLLQFGEKSNFYMPQNVRYDLHKTIGRRHGTNALYDLRSLSKEAWTVIDSF